MPSWPAVLPFGGRRLGTAELVIRTADGSDVARIPEPLRVCMQYLCTRLDLHEGGVPTSIAVTSAVSGEGVTFVSRALAAVLSEDVGRSVCLIDANWWNAESDLPDRHTGLTDLLRASVDVDEVLVETSYPKLHVMRAGSVDDRNRTMLSTTNGMTAVLAELRSRFDQIVLDLPAIATSTTAMTFAAAADASLLVARQRMTRVDQVADAVADLRHTRLLGVVVNDYFVHMPRTLERRLLEE